MLLSKPQQLRFWRDWQAACKSQGWTKQQGLTQPQIDELRHQLLQRCNFTSLTVVDRAAGFDRLLAELGKLQDNIEKTVETDHPELGERRRLLWQIQQITNVLTMPYAMSICRSRFGHTNLDDLSLPHLTQFRNTLNARLQSKRRKSGNDEGRGRPVPTSSVGAAVSGEISNLKSEIPADCPF